MKTHDFPILNETNRGKPLIYLDSGSTAQKPQAVLQALHDFYTHDYANIHRAIYDLAERATLRYEEARVRVQQFIHAQDAAEIVFVRGTTEGINLLAQSYAQTHFRAGDEIILSTMEHHANIVPWYLLKQQMGIVIKEIPVLQDGSLDLKAYQQLFSKRTRLVAVAHVSNALGTINPIKEISSVAHAHGVPILVDGAQAIAHMPVNVTDLDCDFYVFSGHKLYGPSGIGVLYGKKKYLDMMPPYQGGGHMIEKVSFDHITFTKTPHKFEAGTPNIAGTIGLAAAIDYVEQIGMEKIFLHDQQLLKYAEKQLHSIEQVKIIGTAHPKVGVISLVMSNMHPHDIATILDHHGIAVRAGHHCAMPLMQRFNVPATVRVSFGIYNDEADIDSLIEALKVAQKILV